MTDEPLFARAFPSSDREAGCTGKIRYEGPFSAARALKKMSKRHRLDRRAAAYRCRHCGGWHVGRA